MVWVNVGKAVALSGAMVGGFWAIVALVTGGPLAWGQLLYLAIMGVLAVFAVLSEPLVLGRRVKRQRGKFISVVDTLAGRLDLDVLSHDQKRVLIATKSLSMMSPEVLTEARLARTRPAARAMLASLTDLGYLETGALAEEQGLWRLSDGGEMALDLHLRGSR